MAQTKISQLTELSSIADNDVLAGVDTSAGTTKKVKMSTLKSYINTGDAQDVQINGTSVVSGNVANIAVEGTYNASTNKIETVSDVNSKTGTLSNLTTTNKTNLVSAINELNTNKEEVSNKTTTLDENSTNTQYPGAKAVYDLNSTTKEDLENELSKTQAELDQYKTIFNALPKASGTGESISLDGTAESPLKMDLKGNTYQETTSISGGDEYDSPSPDHPQPIQVVSGDNEVYVCGKNLAPQNSFTITGTTSNSGTTGELNGTVLIKNLVVEKNKQYVVSANITDNIGINVYNYNGNLQANDSNHTYNEIIGNNRGVVYTSSPFTASNDYEYIAITLKNKTGYTPRTSITINVNELQLEQGTATSYEPYQSTTYPISLGNLELCNIPNTNYQDMFFKAINGNTIYDSLDSTIKDTLDYGEWYLEKNIGKYIFKGSETFGKSAGYTTNSRWVMYWDSADLNIDQSYDGGYCNFGEVRKVAFISGVQNGIVWNTIGNRMNFVCLLKSMITNWDESATTSEQIALAQNMINGKSFYYVLATPTYTKIEGTLASQLNDIANATSYSTQTNISQISNDLPFIIDAETLLDISNLENRVTLLEE